MSVDLDLHFRALLSVHGSLTHSTFFSFDSTMRLSKLAVIGALALVGLSSANDFENDERETISMEEITREMIQKYGSDIFQGNKGDGGLRKLGNTLPCQQWSCEHGSNPNLVMTFAGRKWGSKLCC